MKDYLDQVREIIQRCDDSTAGIIVVNKDGIVEYFRSMNKLISDDCLALGSDAVGKSLLDLYNEITEENSTTMNTLKTGQITEGQEQVFSVGDSRVKMVTTTYPILDDDGQIQGAVDVAKLLHIDRCGAEPNPDENSAALDRIITVNHHMKQLKNTVRSIARNNSPVILYGETGTGKELFAEALHALSGKCGKPFIAQNCAAIPVNLLESLFFGTERGSFTGAETRMGLFELADGGTLFLDEINSMAPSLQAKLLKVIEEQRVRRIGGREDIPFSVRIVSASNENPELLASSGKMRTDFYYRIGVVKLVIPPLRERPEDILPLCDAFISFFNEKMNKNIVGLSSMTSHLLTKWRWPGNVRELKNVIENAFNLESSPYITLNSVQELFIKMEHQETLHSADIDPDASDPFRLLDQGAIIDLNEVLSHYELRIIQHLMKREVRLAEIARRLSISPQKLQYRLDKLNLHRQSHRD